MHGFEDIDAQENPGAWIEVLDRLSREPFYRRLKSRLSEHVGFSEGGAYLEIGSGTGADALHVGCQYGCTVIGADRSRTLIGEARRRGLAKAIVAEAERLPFPDAVFDGCWAERLFQHLSDPARALREMVRVQRPGGRIVVADPDYGTQTMLFPDEELAHRVLRFRADVGLRNGTMAHRMAKMFHEAGLTGIEVERLTLTVQDARSYDGVFGLRSWARCAAGFGWFTSAEVIRWETLYDWLVSEGRLQWTVDFFITVGRTGERTGTRS